VGKLHCSPHQGSGLASISVNDALQLLPAALIPQGTRLPTGVADVLPVLALMSAAARPGERHKLLRRVDRKYAVPRAQVPELIRALASGYEVLTAAGNTAATYATIYFDTVERQLLADHLRGRRPRHKVRVRHYLDRQLSFLEVKSKTPANRTDKVRRARDYGGNGLTEAEQRWVAGVTGLEAPLKARAWTSCHRITLLRHGTAARVTIDLNVTLGNADGAQQLLGHALVEVKQDRASADLLLIQALRNARARPAGLSKYVAAMMSSAPLLPRSRFVAVLGRFARPEFWGNCFA
jgi:hypothetical protein